MAKKELVLIGSGKIGRGYMADVWGRAGYKLIFIDHKDWFIRKMNEQGYYTVFMDRRAEGDMINFRISGFEAYCNETEYEKCLEALAHTNYATVHIYPGACEEIGHMIGDAVKVRMKNGNTEPLDIFTCVNFQAPGTILKNFALERCNDEEKSFLNEHVGFVETLTFRNGAVPTEEMLKVDELAVYADDTSNWPVDSEAFKGEYPEGINMNLMDNFAARLCYKVWAGNMGHCGSAFYGKHRGYEKTYEAYLDPYIFKNNNLARREASFGICTEYNVKQEAIDSFSRHEPKRFSPETVNREDKDTLNRIGADPIRKLRRNDRWIGPALLSMKYGKIPFFLCRGAAAGFYFVNPDDKAACEIQVYLKENGIEKAVEKYCELNVSDEKERFLRDLIVAQYYDLGDFDPSETDYLRKEEK